MGTSGRDIGQPGELRRMTAGTRIAQRELATTGAGLAVVPLPGAAEIIEALAADDRQESGYGCEVLRLARHLADHHVSQWEAEDACRDHYEDDHAVAGAKRAIDCLNAVRVAVIERIDAWAGGNVPAVPEASLHTETLGTVIDRLAVAWVRSRQLGRASTRSARPSARLEARQALRQLAELGDAYDDLVRDLRGGIRRLPSWSTLKRYGRQR